MEGVDKLLKDGYKLKDKWDIIHHGRRYVFNDDKQMEMKYLNNVRYLNPGIYILFLFFMKYGIKRSHSVCLLRKRDHFSSFRV